MEREIWEFEPRIVGRVEPGLGLPHRYDLDITEEGTAIGL
jgi:hypothetical protein